MNKTGMLKGLFFFSCVMLFSRVLLAAPYTVEHTYQKLKPHYPDIELPSPVHPSPLEERNILYKQVGDHRLGLDIYRYSTDRTQPLLVLIHGGGWNAGSRDMLTPLARAIAQKGFVVASISYRLSGTARFPAAFEDGRDAVLWLKQHAKEYQIDPTRVALAGGSAGGQLAALLAYSGGRLDNEDKPRPFVIQALINLDGLSDFTSEEALPFENDPKKNPSAAGAWFGGRFEDVPELWKRGSPYYYIDKRSPPTLFINSGQSRFGAGRDAAIEELTKHGVHSQVVVFTEAPHAFWHFEPWFGPTVVACVAFLQSQLSPAG